MNNEGEGSDDEKGRENHLFEPENCHKNETTMKEGTMDANCGVGSELRDEKIVAAFPLSSLQQEQIMSHDKSKEISVNVQLKTSDNAAADLNMDDDAPLVLDGKAIKLSSEEKMLFSSLQAAAAFHYATHETADFSESPSSSEASSAFSSLHGLSTCDVFLNKEREELQSKLMSKLSNTTDTKMDDNQAVAGDDGKVLKKNKNYKLNIRVAGGWVRDKLLGLESSDIDVALDDASGVQFAHMVRDYLEYEEEQIASSIASDMSGRLEMGGDSSSTTTSDFDNLHRLHRHHHHKHKYKIGVIAANPEQSKHLETATMKIFGLDVDFVNLRGEEQYMPNSRIPVVKHFGTPKEDAMRRDFTVNSLFYNIQTNCIEDYTKRGISDLKLRTIVTPLSPFTTFHDDPLRVLRAIRFTVRFNFEMAENLRLAAQSKRVHESLICKVSRERVGTELEGMLTGKAADPIKALQLINELRLSDSIFLIGDKEEPLMFGSLSVAPSLLLRRNEQVAKSRQRPCSPNLSSNSTTGSGEEFRHIGWEEAKERLNLTSHVMEHYKKIRLSNEAAINTTLAERLFLLAVYLSPFKDLRWKDPKKAKDYRVVTMSMVKDGIKFKNADVRGLEHIFSCQDEVQQIVQRLAVTRQEDKSPRLSRLDVGLFLRSAKDNWITCLLVAAVTEIRMLTRTTTTITGNSDSMSGSEVISVMEACDSLFTFISTQGLEECWKWKPFFSGKGIMQALKLPKQSGPIVGVLIDEEYKWMLQNPHGTQNDCEQFLKQILPDVKSRMLLS